MSKPLLCNSARWTPKDRERIGMRFAEDPAHVSVFAFLLSAVARALRGHDLLKSHERKILLSGPLPNGALTGRTLVGVASIVAVAVSVAAGYCLGRARASGEVASSTSPPNRADAASRARSQPPPQNGGLRPQIRAAIEQAPVRNGAELDGYLDSLEAQARRRGQVTALEVEPGLEAIRRHAEDPAKAAQFSERMLRLQRELQRTSASAQLNSGDLAGRQAADPGSADVLWQAIETEADSQKRQDLIREYLWIVERLDDAERSERLHELDSRFGMRSVSERD